MPYIQLASQNVTRKLLIAFTDLKPIETYQELYSSLQTPPEISHFMKTGNLTEEEKKFVFTTINMKEAFGLDYKNPLKSLLNPVIGERFMDQMERKVPLRDLSYRYNMGINNYAFYTLLNKYIKYLIANFVRAEHSGGTSKDAAFSQLLHIAGQRSANHIRNHIDYKLYARLLFAKFSKLHITCQSVFRSARIDATKTNKICSTTGFDFKTPESFEPWTAMYHPTMNTTDMVVSRFNFDKYDIMNFTNSSLKGSLTYYIKEIKGDAARYYECSSPNECSADELAALQWGASKVTRTIEGVYNVPFVKNVETLQDWMLTSSLEPQEYYVFAKKNKKEQKEVVIEKDAAMRLIKDVFAHQFETLKLAVYTRDYKKLENEYKIKHGYLLHGYTRHIIEHNLFGGVYSNRTARELAWGFYDQFLTSVVTSLYPRSARPTTPRTATRASRTS